MNLSNNTILITGGGSGIGLALAKEFIQLNNRVIICGRNLEKLKTAKQENSTMLNVSSALAFVPMSAAPIYNATKAALHSYSTSIRQQLQNTNIKVIELLPAAIVTDMAIEMEKSLGIENNGPKMTPEKLAMLTIRGLKNDVVEIRPGMANTLYFIHRIFPSLAQKMIASQSKKMLLKL